MYIIVAGGGKVGFYLAQHLLAEDHEVLLVERNPARVAEINEVLGAVAITGDAAEATRVAEAKMAKDQLMLALRLASSKLSLVQKKTQPETVHNQHKVG